MIYGNNPTLLTVNYIRPEKDKDIEESFEIIYKTEDGTVHKSNEPAEADIYFVKPEYRTYTYNKPQESLRHLDKYRVPISKIRYVIADQMGESGKELIKKCYQERNFKGLNQVYKWPYSFGADFQPEYYYMKNWYEKYQMNNVKLTKAFMDIETDLMDYETDLDNLSSTSFAPVNLITVFLEETHESFTFVLKPYEPPKMGRSPEEYEFRYNHYLKQKADHEKLMNDIPGFFKDLDESFSPIYGEVSYNLREYDQEIDLIADVFRLINNRKPNFCLQWNMRFDIQYLYYRIQVLGYDPKSIMCHPDFKNPKCYFHVDKMVFQVEKQYDYFYCSSYTQYICQMRLYASIRKSQQKLKSVSLNAIGDKELKDRKVEYPEESNIILFPYMDWIRFIKYNIKDVLIQVGIERKTHDVLTYYSRSHSNLTPYNKIFRETYLLRNVREMYFEKDGCIQGNNINILDDDKLTQEERNFYGIDDDDEDESTFKGAIMADPIWNDKVGMLIAGERSNNIIPNAMDYDMGAFYPSIKIASNMDPSTLLYKASFVNNEFISGEFPNRSLNTTYQEKDKNGKLRNLDITGEAINTYISGNVLTFASNYLGLPNMTELIRDVMKELKSA